MNHLLETIISPQNTFLPFFSSDVLRFVFSRHRSAACACRHAKLGRSLQPCLSHFQFFSLFFFFYLIIAFPWQSLLTDFQSVITLILKTRVSWCLHNNFEGKKPSFFLIGFIQNQKATVIPYAAKFIMTC